ncbi:hypothetical protein N0V90_008861 [Kalmusia sp. IMI 367209]|nr:hypothetical protein N0V90_008861 [Kalmusia sp. IMI 367209]
MAPQKQAVIKFTSRRYKAAGVSDADFHAFATSDHAPKAAPIQARHGILGVAQYHKPAPLRAILTEGPLAAVRPPNWTVDDHDIELVFYLRNPEQIGALMADPDFQELMKAEVHLVDQERANISIGWEEVFVEDGKVVNVDGAKSSYPSWAETVETLTGKKPT